jgi:hypothetical protein
MYSTSSYLNVLCVLECSAAAKRTVVDQLQKELALERKRVDLYKERAEAVQRQYEVACQVDAQRQRELHALERRVMELRVESTDKDVKLAEVQFKLAQAAKSSAELERDALALKLQTHISEAKAPSATLSAANVAAAQVAVALITRAHRPCACTVSW